MRLLPSLQFGMEDWEVAHSQQSASHNTPEVSTFGGATATRSSAQHRNQWRPPAGAAQGCGCLCQGHGCSALFLAARTVGRGLWTNTKVWTSLHAPGIGKDGQRNGGETRPGRRWRPAGHDGVLFRFVLPSGRRLHAPVHEPIQRKISSNTGALLLRTSGTHPG